MTILVAGGDSFTFGTELSHDVPGPSPCAWPRILASKMNWTLSNVSLAGSSNSAIARRVITEVEAQKNKNDVKVSVMWSYPNRYEFRFLYDTNNRDTPWRSCTTWDLEKPNLLKPLFRSDNEIVYDQLQENYKFLKGTGMYDFLDMFYRQVGNSEYYETYTSLKEIVHLQNYLKLNNIKYIFMCCDNILFSTKSYNEPDRYIRALKDQIDWSSWYMFPDNLGFNQWATDNNYEYATTHPLERAHFDAVELILENNYDKLV